MAKICQVTGKKPMSGNNVSHAHNKTRRRFLPNLQTKKFWVESENKWVRLRVSAKGLRIIDKNGFILADSKFKYSLIVKPQHVTEKKWQKYKFKISLIYSHNL